MSERTRIVWLVIVMMVAVTVSTTVAITVLYETAFEQERSHLIQNADDQAHLIEAVARFDRAHHPGDAAGSADATLSQIESAFDHYPSDGQVAEIAVAQLIGDEIVYLVTHGRPIGRSIDPIPFDSPLAEPMRRALQGQSGSMIGLDYRGVEVLAAYEPVPMLNAGVVAKMDLSDLRAPFLKGAAMVIGLALVLISIGTVLFFRLTSPIVKHLTDTEEQLHLIMESTGEGIFGLDGEGRCTFINRAGLQALGYRDENEVLGRDMHRLVHHSRHDGSPLPAEDCAIYRARGQNIGVRLEDEQLWRADGTGFPADYRSYPMSKDGAVVGAVVMFTDITERKEREAKLLHAQKMEVVGHLTGGIAHDFNNLIAIILANLNFLEHKLAEEADTETGELIADARSAAQDGADLIRGLLMFARRQPLEPQGLDLAAFIGHTARFLCRLAGQGIELILKQSAGSLPVRVDRQQLENVVLNLTINARDAMPDGGTLTIRTGRESVSAEDGAKAGLAPGRYVVVSIADTGVGMSPDEVRRAVEPFYSTKAMGKGTGLGLSTALGFAQQSGGDLKITSTPGHGTIVTLYLPEAPLGEPEDGVAATRTAPTQTAGGTRTVLVVDDEPSTRRLACGILSDLGYRVLEAGSADAAIGVLESETWVDLLFTDVVMPGAMNGLELGRWALRHRPEVKVLLTSGFPQQVSGKEARDGDGLPFLKKPYSEQELDEAVRALLETPVS